MTPQAAGGKWRAHLVDVKVGLVNSHYVEIKSGLQEGDQVIYAGYESLKEGDPVVPTEWGSQGPLTLPPATGAATRGRSYRQPSPTQALKWRKYAGINPYCCRWWRSAACSGARVARPVTERTPLRHCSTRSSGGSIPGRQASAT